MLNFNLKKLPPREEKPRNRGVSMVMDKGLSVREAEDLCQTAGHLIDYIKLGFGTSLVTAGLQEKIAVYHSHNIRVYVGGTLFEAFVIRGMYNDYVEYIRGLGLKSVEISDGSMKMDHAEKCRYITELAEEFDVLSEVGSKDASVVIPAEEWAAEMNRELAAGASLVIAEARESGTVGIYDASGKAETSLITSILKHVDGSKIMWEAPLKAQQVWFIKKLGSEVNLGNIAPSEVIAAETLRLGLRGDTFHDFIDQ